MRCCLSIVLLLAMTTEVKAMDLVAAFERAQESDRQLAAARFEHEAAVAQRPLARADYLPQILISAAIGCERQEQSTREGSGANPAPAHDCAEIFGAETARTENIAANLSQPIIDAPAWLGMGRAERATARADIRLAEAEQALLLRVARTYFDVLAADDALRFALAERDAVTEQRELAEQRFEVGLSAITDVQEAQARYDLTIARALEAAQALFDARDALQEIIDQRPAELARPETAFSTPPPDPVRLEPWIERARTQNLALRIAELDAELAERDTAIARAQRWPTLDLQARYGRSEQPGFVLSNETRRIGLSLEVPVFTGGRISAQVDQAAAIANQRDAEREGTLRSVLRTARNGFQSIRTSRALVAALQKAVRSNETALEAAEAGVEVGTRTAVDVLDAQQALFSARSDLSRARYDYMLAVLELERAAGSLGPDDLLRLNELLSPGEPLLKSAVVEAELMRQ